MLTRTVEDMYEEIRWDPEPTPALVERWEGSGGTWRIDLVTAHLVRILLCTCDGGEVVDIIETADASTIRWAAAQQHGD